eukprot:g8050.t1 g8050   contig27:73342-76182(-)
MANDTAMNASDTSSPPSSAKAKRRKTTAKLTICTFLFLILIETNEVQHWLSGNSSLQLRSNGSLQFKTNQQHVYQVSDDGTTNSQHITWHVPDYSYTISDNVKKEYKQWHLKARHLSQLDLIPSNWTPAVNWKNHPAERSDRFPSVEERLRYYMGKWYNASVPMYGSQFERDTFIQRKTTRQYGTFSDILVNLYNLDKEKLTDCYNNKKELHVMAPYCRDYMDLAILHSEGSANVIHNIGDGLPTYVPEEIVKYPMFNKVRPLSRNDVQWEEKMPKAVWRGQYGKTDKSHNGSDIDNTHDIKYALVSKHLNSSLVDAKFSRHADSAPPLMAGSYLDMKDQLRYKYIISIEGNDVSSGLKWMLFSNSIVLAPSFTWEGWAMEGLLEPHVHYLPLKEDMSNVEEMIAWAEDHPNEVQLIRERSTVFIHDLLFHPEAIHDEREVIQGIMERFEHNFGSRGSTKQLHPLEIDWESNSHPTDRGHRFPSVEERVQYYMGRWYDNNNSMFMKRSNVQQLATLYPDTVVTDAPFIASGHVLTQCAMPNSTFTQDVRRLCRESLTEFDERSTADLKSNAFNRLRKTERGEGIKLASMSSWRSDGKGMKESKRVILDDSVRIISVGSPPKDTQVPIFAQSRDVDGDNEGSAILWPFGMDLNNSVMTGIVEKADTNFRSKEADAVLARDSRTDYESLRELLSHRYLVTTGERTSSDVLEALLLSQSIVLMPNERQSTSWLMETALKPYVHFVPIKRDHSDIAAQMQWCENNLEAARKISERASLYVHDMLFDAKAGKDNEEIRFRIMERYLDLYG